MSLKLSSPTEDDVSTAKTISALLMVHPLSIREAFNILCEVVTELVHPIE